MTYATSGAEDILQTWYLFSLSFTYIKGVSTIYLDLNNVAQAMNSVSDLPYILHEITNL